MCGARLPRLAFLGKAALFPASDAPSPRFIINFPTKRRWRHPSKLEYIQEGLDNLIEQVKRLEITSIAIPPLGCGNGGLDWSVVRPIIIDAFATVPNVRVVLFEPADAPPADQIIDRRPKPRMTPERAAILALMGRYAETDYGYRLSLVEVQKLAYFLQLAGENLRLEYYAHHYGPYADNLRKALSTYGADRCVCTQSPACCGLKRRQYFSAMRGSEPQP